MNERESDSTISAVEESQADAEQRKEKGEFVRGISKFRNTLGEHPDFAPEPNRYHLFVALNCPWCHRVTLVRYILGLQDSITMDIAFPNRTGIDDPDGKNEWEFSPERYASLTGRQLPECTSENGTGKKLRLVKEIYEEEGSQERSVPILYDKKFRRIVSNESAEIVRMLNRQAGPLGSTFDDLNRLNLYPDDIQSEIDTLNEEIYVNINNGAYKAGFSSDQGIYSNAFLNYFKTLKVLEVKLSSDNRPFLTGDHFTEADLRLFPTLYRHDPVYYLRMKLNGAKILNYPHFWRWLCRVYALHGVAESNSLVHCKQGYFGRSGNNVVPIGPFHPMEYPEAYSHPELAE